MAVNANYFTLLCLGFTLWVGKYSKPAIATGLGMALGPEAEQEAAVRRYREKYGPYLTMAEYYTSATDEETDCRNKVTTALSLEFFGYRWWRKPVEITCDRIDIGNLNGINIRARNPKHQLGVTISNNKIYLRGKVVCNDIKKKDNKSSYQKSSDGTYWYTNLKVGGPMAQAEIDTFEAEWAEHEAAIEDVRRRQEGARIRREEQREKERAIQEKVEDRYREQRIAEEKLRKEGLQMKRREFEEERKRLRIMRRNSRKA